MLSGIIFDIKELAIHDGPGIRITIFMKGCPLRCSWCHNPEGLLPQPQVIHRQDGQRQAGKWYTSKELSQIINKKTDFLRMNEGGVTFSGGEPLSQAKFIVEVIDMLKEVHVLLDTSGYGNEADFRLLAERSDLVFFDLKLIDNNMHKKYTGCDNATILSNLQLLSALNVPFVVRVPLVPAVTDTDKNLSDIAKLIKDLPGLLQVDLLPYNKAAGGKYKAVGMEFNPGFDESCQLNANIDVFRNEGLKVKVV
ncbi:MAG: radical SAM protein [Planctomycetota bacterium]